MVQATVDLVDLNPVEAVRASRQAHVDGDSDAWDRLDRSLRYSVLVYLLRLEGTLELLQAGLLEAIDVAVRVAGQAWELRWTALLDVLEEGRKMPTLERSLKALPPDGHAARLLQALADQRGPLRSGDLAELLFPERANEDSARSQVSRALGQLEDAGLIDRHKMGRATWVCLTPLGGEAARVRGPAQPEPAIIEVANNNTWHDQALHEPVAMRS